MQSSSAILVEARVHMNTAEQTRLAKLSDAHKLAGLVYMYMRAKQVDLEN